MLRLRRSIFYMRNSLILMLCGLVVENQCGDCTRNPSSQSQQENDQHGSTPAIQNRKGWKNNTQYRSKTSHISIISRPKNQPSVTLMALRAIRVTE